MTSNYNNDFISDIPFFKIIPIYCDCNNNKSIHSLHEACQTTIYNATVMSQ